MDQTGSSTNQNFNWLMNHYYYDIEEPSSFGGIRKVHNVVKRVDPTIKYKDIAKWLLKQETYGIHRYYKDKIPTNPIVSRTYRSYMEWRFNGN